MLTNHDYAVFHGRVLDQNSFNLSELDSISTDLDLIIRTAQEFDIPVRPVTSYVTGSI